MSNSTAELASIVRDVQNARFATLSASAIIVFDHLITLDQEIELRSPWTLGKLLFLLNRYYPLSTVLPLVAPLARMERLHRLILQLRIYALYFLNKKVMFFVGSFFVLSLAAAGTIMGLVLSNFSTNAETIAGLNFCMPSDVPRYIYAYWIPIITFESLLCGMAILRAVQGFRHHEPSFISGTRLITILLRDSIVYFLIIFLTYLVNLLLWSTGILGLIEVPVGFTMAMSCVMGSRLVLNVRYMKRELELGIHGRQRNILHIPFHSRPSVAPSPVMFASPETGMSGVEYVEMLEMDSRESASTPNGLFDL
ncbi:hypothetical protein HWV62_9619 [Athelia sp. TMB]|nr:hypothetical protein HWV62_9619 [Athelia sp. TMB]